MERLIEAKLLEWKDSPGRKPLILLGLRQSGKTYVLKKFGREHFSNVAYFDFENREDLCRLFWNLDAHRLLEELSRVSNTEITEDTLIIFDEVQACHRAISSLKYFHQDAPQYHIACAGSLLGPAVGDGRAMGAGDPDADWSDSDVTRFSFPVGKVSFLRMRPMCFGEFVMARSGRGTFEYLDSLGPTDRIPDDLMSVLESLYAEYLLVGGMPEAVDAWCGTNDIAEVRRIQRNIITSYERDMGRYSAEDFARITAIWRSAAYQIAERGDRFRLKDVGGRLGTAIDPIEWLLGADMLRRAWEVNDDRNPPNPRGGIYFKLYYPDVGLLTCRAGIEYDTLTDRDGGTSDIRGAVAENYVLNQLDYALDGDGDAYYWTNPKGAAEVDFQVTVGRDPVPVEVKSGKVGRMHGLETYVSRYHPKASFVISGKNVRIGGADEYTFVPLYMAWKFGMYAEAAGLRTKPMDPPPLPEWTPPEG